MNREQTIRDVRKFLDTEETSGEQAAKGMLRLQEDGMTQREIAEAVGVSPMTVNRYLAALVSNGYSFRDALTANRQGEKQRSVVAIVEETRKMSQPDRIKLINNIQTQVDADKTPKVPKEQGPLDVMVASDDMADALDDLEAAEPAWSAAVREGTIVPAVAAEDYSRLDILRALMADAIKSESFETSVPR